MTGIVAAILIFRIVWVLTILVGTSYVVFWLGYSGWWWVLAVVLMAGSSSAEAKSGTNA